MNKTPAIHRRGFGLKDHIEDDLAQKYHSRLLAYLQKHGNELHLGDLHIFLAHKFGFCYGVERSIEYAYETLQRFAGRKIYLLGEIVHNPYVNNQLRQNGVIILNGLQQKQMDYSFIRPEDVVILPAFGVTHTALNRLKQRKCDIVDTTCGSVLTVWKRVEYYAQNGFTTIIHGKYPHEETIAICSQISKYPEANYLVVKNLHEGTMIADFIAGKMSYTEVLRHFSGRYSTGFNPAEDLQKIGFANQTTMLGGESLQIAAIVRKAYTARYGKEQTEGNFHSFDTICSATQDRQDAVRDLLSSRNPDMMMIVGGFNSSNTAQLVQIAAKSIPSYHIRDSTDLISKREIRHQSFPEKKVLVTDNWLPDGAVKIGITAGASTPARKIGQVLYRLFELKNIPAEKIKSLVNAT